MQPARIPEHRPDAGGEVPVRLAGVPHPHRRQREQILAGPSGSQTEGRPRAARGGHQCHFRRQRHARLGSVRLRLPVLYGQRARQGPGGAAEFHLPGSIMAGGGQSAIEPTPPCRELQRGVRRHVAGRGLDHRYQTGQSERHRRLHAAVPVAHRGRDPVHGVGANGGDRGRELGAALHRLHRPRDAQHARRRRRRPEPRRGDRGRVTIRHRLAVRRRYGERRLVHRRPERRQQNERILCGDGQVRDPQRRRVGVLRGRRPGQRQRRRQRRQYGGGAQSRRHRGAARRRAECRRRRAGMVYTGCARR